MQTMAANLLSYRISSLQAQQGLLEHTSIERCQLHSCVLPQLVQDQTKITESFSPLWVEMLELQLSAVTPRMLRSHKPDVPCTFLRKAAPSLHLRKILVGTHADFPLRSAVARECKSS